MIPYKLEGITFSPLSAEHMGLKVYYSKKDYSLQKLLFFFKWRQAIFI